MAVKIDKGEALGSLSLTSLIDVVFLLLIFFLVATRFAEEDREMDIRIPVASEAKPLAMAPKEIFINIDKDGRVIVAKRVVNNEALYQLLQQAVANNPTQSAIIRADERCEFRHVVRVGNLCTKAGVAYTSNVKTDGG